MNTPNPGSPEAVEQGCECPVLDNGRGNEKLGQERGFWINGNCPLHGTKLSSTNLQERTE